MLIIRAVSVRRVGLLLWEILSPEKDWAELPPDIMFSNTKDTITLSISTTLLKYLIDQDLLSSRWPNTWKNPRNQTQNQRLSTNKSSSFKRISSIPTPIVSTFQSTSLSFNATDSQISSLPSSPARKTPERRTSPLSKIPSGTSSITFCRSGRALKSSRCHPTKLTLIGSGRSPSSPKDGPPTCLLLGNKLNFQSNGKLESRSEKTKAQGVGAKNLKRYNHCNHLALKN